MDYTNELEQTTSFQPDEGALSFLSDTQYELTESSDISGMEPED